MLLGCGRDPADPVASTPGPTEETDTEPTDGLDTAIGVLYAEGSWQTADGVYLEGTYAHVIRNPSLEVVCRADYDWAQTGSAPPGCPLCDWAFHLTLSGGEEVGEGCLGGFEGVFDGYAGYWGLAMTYAYAYGDTVYEYDGPWIFSYSESYDYWWAVMGPPSVTGDATYASFSNEGGYAYYLLPG